MKTLRILLLFYGVLGGLLISAFRLPFLSHIARRPSHSMTMVPFPFLSQSSAVEKKALNAAAIGIPVKEYTPYLRAVKYETQLAKEAKSPLLWTKDDTKDIRARVLNLWKDEKYKARFLHNAREMAKRQLKKDAIEAKFNRIKAKQLYFERRQEAARINVHNYRVKRYRSIQQKMHLIRVRVARGLSRDIMIQDLLGPELWYEEKLRMRPDILRPSHVLSDADLEKALRKRWVNETYTQEDLELIERNATMWVDLDDERIRAHRKQSRDRLYSGYYYFRAVEQRVEEERLRRLAQNITEPTEEEIYLKEGDDGYHYKYSRHGHFVKQMLELYNPKIVIPKDRSKFFDFHVYDDKGNHIVYNSAELYLFMRRTQPYNRMIFNGKTELIDDNYLFVQPYKDEVEFRFDENGQKL